VQPNTPFFGLFRQCRRVVCIVVLIQFLSRWLSTLSPHQRCQEDSKQMASKAATLPTNSYSPGTYQTPNADVKVEPSDVLPAMNLLYTTFATVIVEVAITQGALRIRTSCPRCGITATTRGEKDILHVRQSTNGIVKHQAHDIKSQERAVDTRSALQLCPYYGRGMRRRRRTNQVDDDYGTGRTSRSKNPRRPMPSCPMSTCNE